MYLKELFAIHTWHHQVEQNQLRKLPAPVQVGEGRMPLNRKGRIIDLSRGAAKRIGLIGPGTGRVRLEVVR